MHCLRKTYDGYSPGTRVTVMNFTKANSVFVSVNATKEVIEIPVDELIELRQRTQVVSETSSRQRRRDKKVLAND